MKITRLYISNVLGVEELEIAPGNITTISGKNGAGKSSTLKAVQNILGGGSLSEIRNVNSDAPPEIVLHMESDAGEIIVKKTAKTTTVRKQIEGTAAFEDMPKPQSFLNGLFDGKLSNPVAFLKAKPKERVDLMLEAIDLPYDETELFKQMGLSPQAWPKVGPGVHPLAAVEYHRGNVFNERTGVNRDEKSKRASAQELLQDTPADLPEVEDITEKETVLQGMRETRIDETARADAKKEKDITDAETKFDKIEAKANADYRAIEAKLKLEMEDRLKKERDQTLETIADAQNERDYDKRSAELEHEKQIALIDTMDPTIDELTSDIATAKERQKNVIAFEAIKKKAKMFESDAADLLDYSRTLTDALKALDAYKASMCSGLPVPGLEIQGNEILVDGVKWDQLNTSKQIEVAVKVATLRGKDKKLNIVLVDGAEALDAESLKLLREHLEAEKAQAFAAMVSNGPLEVKV